MPMRYETSMLLLFSFQVYKVAGAGCMIGVRTRQSTNVSQFASLPVDIVSFHLFKCTKVQVESTTCVFAYEKERERKRKREISMMKKIENTNCCILNENNNPFLYDILMKCLAFCELIVREGKLDYIEHIKMSCKK